MHLLSHFQNLAHRLVTCGAFQKSAPHAQKPRCLLHCKVLAPGRVRGFLGLFCPCSLVPAWSIPHLGTHFQINLCSAHPHLPDEPQWGEKEMPSISRMAGESGWRGRDWPRRTGDSRAAPASALIFSLQSLHL